MIWEIEDGPRAVEGLDERGRPRPEYAAALGLVSAPIGRRVLATFAEVLFVTILQLPLLIGALPALISLAGSPTPIDDLFGRGDAVWIIVFAGVPYALTTVFIIVQLVLLGRRGVTLGKALTGLRAVNVATLERPKFWRGAVVRYLVLSASFLLPLIGPLLVIALSPLFDPQRRRRGWPDLAAAMWIVDIKKGLNPYDAKRMRIARKTVATDLKDEKASLPSLATPVSAPTSDVYIPVARNRGGVVGAPRERTGAAPAGDGEYAGPPAPIQASPFAGPADPYAQPAPLPSRGPQAPVVPVEPARPAPEPAASVLPASPPPAAAPSAASASAPVPAGHPVSETFSVASETLLPQGETWSPPSLMEGEREASLPSAPAPVAASLVIDTGETVTVGTEGAVIGRSPRTAGEDAAAAPIAVPDTTMSVSKTHVALRWQDGSLVAVDLGSTNGSAVLRGGAESELTPGVGMPLRSGDTLRFGDRHATISIA